MTLHVWVDRKDIEKKVNPNQIVISSENFQKAVDRLESSFTQKAERKVKQVLSKMFRVNMFKIYPSKDIHRWNTDVDGSCVHSMVIDDTVVSFHYSQYNQLFVKLQGVYRDVKFYAVLKTDDKKFIRTAFNFAKKDF